MEALSDAVGVFMKEDSELLENDAHEQAISHRIAHYLEDCFGLNSKLGLNIDCEYNKHLNEKKRIDVDPTYYFEKFPHCFCFACCEIRRAIKQKPRPDLNIQERLFRPDIVVHERGCDRRNRIAIEVKKSVVCPFDLSKLRALTSAREEKWKFSYDLGVFLHFPKQVPQFKWFLDGDLLDL